ncbi:MAG: hypothetical protein KDE17_18115 [Rhodobacteraceae bacterium]|nr:hypothetical protein [Paracoccaceae bacterium]
MSAWTDRARMLTAYVAGVVWLVSGQAAAAGDSAPSKITVSDGAITISGPSGYCVDTRSSRDAPEGAFVLLGSCVSLNGSGRAPGTRALLTATILLGAPPGEDLRVEFRRMADFFVTEAGRTALSRDGDPGSVRITKIVASGDILYVLAQDNAPLAGYPVEPEYWRAIFARRGRMISLSVLGLPEAPIDTNDKRRLLDRFVSRIVTENS